MQTKDFDLDSGALCLDFANTLEWRGAEQPIEYLAGYDDLIDWGAAAGILKPEAHSALRRAANRRGKQAAAAYRDALELREAIYRIFAAWSVEEEVDPADLEVLNRAVQRALPNLRLVLAKNGCEWEWETLPDSLEQVHWQVARSAANLLTSEDLDRVRECADDRGCAYLFIDTSRNRSRRWCSMESCGNRAKARRFYRRQQTAADGAE